MKTKLLVLLMLVVTAGSAKAEKFWVKDLFYSVMDDETCEVIDFDEAFTSADIPESVVHNGHTYRVTKIGDNAFAFCSGLSYLTIPNSVTTIGKYAFSGCTSLLSVTIPGSVTSIGNGVFDSSGLLRLYCLAETPPAVSLLTFRLAYAKVTLYVSAGCKSVYEAADHWKGFSRIADLFKVGSLFYDITGDGICKVIDCDGKAVTVDIPESVSDGNRSYLVTEIGEGAFYGCGMSSVTIPNSVTEIGEFAFNYCSRLSFVTIPNSVTSIGKGAFYYCFGLSSVTIPDSVTEIGEYAFYYCHNLYSITIPRGVTKIKYGAFVNCSRLFDVFCLAETPPVVDGGFNFFFTLYVPTGCKPAYEAADCWKTFPRILEGNGISFSLDGLSYAIENDETCIVVGCDKNVTAVEIPENVTHEGHTYLVTSIKSPAFGNCSRLSSVTIPGSVKRIGDDAFKGCSRLDDIYCLAEIPPTIESWAFDSYTATLHIPVGSKAAYEAANCWMNFGKIVDGNEILFREGSLAYGIIDDGACVVIDCDKNVTTVEIPKNVTHEGRTYLVTAIGRGAFSQCSRLSSITISDGVTSIGGYAFSRCSNLSSVIIPNGVTLIGEFAFYNCSGLSSVTIPNSVTEIGAEAFAYCNSLSSATIPNGVTTIEEGVFCCCISLSSVIIPDGVMSIGAEAFYYCPGLSSVTIPNSVTEIGAEAFAYCNSLSSATIPNGVTTIKSGAFYGCRSLPSITIPNSVTTMEWGAFSRCSSLTDIYCYAEVPPVIEDGTFESYTATLHVPVGSKAAYKAADYWKNFRKIIEEESMAIDGAVVESVIGYSAGILSLKGLGVPASVTVYTQDGKCVSVCVVTVGKEACDLTSLPEGIYLVQVRAGSESTVLKIVR